MNITTPTVTQTLAYCIELYRRDDICIFFGLFLLSYDQELWEPSVRGWGSVRKLSLVSGRHTPTTPTTFGVVGVLQFGAGFVGMSWFQWDCVSVLVCDGPRASAWLWLMLGLRGPRPVWQRENVCGVT